MPSTPADVVHLLRRVGFGVTPAELPAYTRLDRPQLIDAVLDTSAAPPVTRPAALDDPAATEYQRWVAMTQWWTERMRVTPAPLVEKMALFWHGHLVSSMAKVPAVAMFDQNQLFRSQGLGSFRDLCQAMAVQPAMLLYLDNHRNKVGAPNENFSRECMELFTLGVNSYSQTDVAEVARAWTGHGLDADKVRYVFHPRRHDTGTKTIFGISKNWDGPDVIDEILLRTHRTTAARFLAARMWSFFAYPSPEPAVVEAVAAAYLDAGLSVRAMVRAILERPEFWSDRARGALVRSPIEYVVAAMKATGLPAGTARPEWYLEGMGQRPFDPPNVSGWRQNGYWISSTALWAKAAFAGYVRWKAQEAGCLADTRQLSVPTAVQRALDVFGIVAPSTRTRAALEAFVTAERSTSRWAEQPNLVFCTLLTPDFQLA